MSCPVAQDIRDFLESYCNINTEASYSRTGNTTNGSPIISSMDSTANLKEGMRVSGVGILIDSVITSVDSSSQITIDQNATADGTTVALTITYYSLLSDEWINKRKNNFVIPHVKRITRQSFDATAQVTEYYNGNASTILVLNRRPIVSLDDINLVNIPQDTSYISVSSIEVITAEGILKVKSNFEESQQWNPIFPKGKYNIKVTYTYGMADCPDDVSEAIIYLTSSVILGHLASRTGGGDLSVQSFSRNWGSDRGKWGQWRSEIERMGMSLLRKYMTGVVG